MKTCKTCGQDISETPLEGLLKHVKTHATSLATRAKELKDLEDPNVHQRIGIERLDKAAKKWAVWLHDLTELLDRCKKDQA